VLEGDADGLLLRRRLGQDWSPLALGGLASIALGLLLAATPSALTVGRWLGAYSLLPDASLLLVGLRLRAFTSDHERASLKQPAESL
jgi:uncharacterized membrane protein HdeD (DUF308 family)